MVSWPKKDEEGMGGVGENMGVSLQVNKRERGGGRRLVFITPELDVIKIRLVLMSSKPQSDDNLSPSVSQKGGGTRRVFLQYNLQSP